MKDLFSKPNQITFIRILLIPIFVMFLLMDLPYKNYIAAFIFIILSLSDALDGYIARKKQQITNIGKILDPIADKLLISTALIFLFLIGSIQLWMAAVIIVRELVITALRIFFLPKRVVISASYLGKIKTVSQIIAIVAVILNAPLNWWLMLIAVIITIVSGFDYITKMGKLRGENVLNLPNLITTFRLFLIPLFLINLVKANMNSALIIVAIFILSDKLDGISARVTQQITKFGSGYDVFTDFVGIVSAYIVFSLTGMINLYWIVIFIIPTVIIAIIRLFNYIKIKQDRPYAFRKFFVGVVYVTGIAIIIDFIYAFQMLVLAALLVYVYMFIEIYRTMKISKFS
ncbi:CDP-diacylglycerol--glycerol-3-phosphate 3-phosphatidyltransferase [Candidatus Woesearchaeota archaeon]|nr:CDP-diacylglycerol--glycerol-3-phosphate 3-phosphatidyltransferase [Candidatus Woesearchaeota archaeon]|tara:strand:- start:4985 stop:6019 length:1035 start_codon:yes stop_codon:yes gene_type:complete